jgi:hypothetical protein
VEPRRNLRARARARVSRARAARHHAREPARDPTASTVARLQRLGIGPRPVGDPTIPRGVCSRAAARADDVLLQRDDGIVAWRSCLADDGPFAENLAVASSHCGMGHHPTVLLAIADRLAQREGGWRPYVPRTSAWWPFSAALQTR